MSVFRETLHSNIEGPNVHPIFFFGFFWQYNFYIVGASTPMRQIRFPILFVLFSSSYVYSMSIFLNSIYICFCSYSLRSTYTRTCPINFVVSSPHRFCSQLRFDRSNPQPAITCSAPNSRKQYSPIRLHPQMEGWEWTNLNGSNIEAACFALVRFVSASLFSTTPKFWAKRQGVRQDRRSDCGVNKVWVTGR